MNSTTYISLSKEDLRNVIREEMRLMQDRYLKRHEAAEILSVSKGTFDKYVKEGRLKPRQIEGCVRYLYSEVMQVFQESTIQD